jgi:hypothetical protein
MPGPGSCSITLFERRFYHYSNDIPGMCIPGNSSNSDYRTIPGSSIPTDPGRIMCPVDLPAQVSVSQAGGREDTGIGDYARPL